MTTDPQDSAKESPPPVASSPLSEYEADTQPWPPTEPAESADLETQPAPGLDDETITVPASPLDIIDADKGMPVDEKGASDSAETPSPGQTEDLIQASLIEKVEQGFAALSQAFESKIKYDTHKDATIDKLHSEVQEYKQGLLLKLLRPFILDVVQTLDDLNRQVEHYQNKPVEELDPKKLLKDLCGFTGDLEDILYRQGVDDFQAEDNAFDPKRQKAIERVPTPDAELARKVAERIRKGYQWEGQVVRPELVSVYVYKKAHQETGQE